MHLSTATRSERWLCPGSRLSALNDRTSAARVVFELQKAFNLARTGLEVAADYLLDAWPINPISVCLCSCVQGQRSCATSASAPFSMPVFDALSDPKLAPML